MSGEPNRSATTTPTPLTALMAEHLCTKLIALDAPYVREGLLEPWVRDNYAVPLPDKDLLSAVMLSEGEPLGYRIVSGRWKFERYAHAHRLVVGQDWRGRGIARTLLEYTHQLAAEQGYIGITAQTGPRNYRMKRILLAAGYQKVESGVSENLLYALSFESR